MYRKIILISAVLIIFTCIASGQQYTAKGYWLMEHDSTYLSMLNRQAAGETLSQHDLEHFESFKTNLALYFAQMTDDEKASYFKNRSTWSSKPGTVFQQEDQVYAGERSTFTKYVTASSIYGFLYGAATVSLLGIDSEAAVGIPFITAGASALLPLISIKDKMITTNSLLLSLHGKAMGGFQGAMLGLTIVGAGDYEGADKVILGLATASSITLGHVGYAMGRKSNWTPGKVSFYTHYGWLMSLESIALAGSFSIEDPRIYGISSLLGGTAGYLLAKGVTDRNNYTRGDVFSIQTFTWLNGLLGFGIFSEIENPSNASVLIPATTAMAGALLGQHWMKNANLSNQQGRNIILATTGGSAIGFGLGAMISSDEWSTLNYVIPYITGLATYSVIAESYKRKNNSQVKNNSTFSNWQFNLMPQNILLNNRIASSGRPLSGNRMSLLPAFSASVVF